MSTKSASSARCAVIVGAYTSGKTSLMEAMLSQAGALHRKGSVNDGSSLGDGSAEARDRQMSVEPNFAHAEYLGDSWSIIDCPGSVELLRDSHTALMAADVAVVVATPEEARALTLGPIFKFLDEYEIPHVLFINKMDKASVSVRQLMESLQEVSERPLVLRQVPIRDDEEITGFVDLVSERAWKYNPDKQSDLIEMPDTVLDREDEARQEMLESLADFDDNLLEQLLEEKIPATGDVYDYLKKDLADDLIVPVIFGSAEVGNGITRLWKLLRHETPECGAAAARLSVPTDGLSASVVKSVHASHTGKLSIARVWSGKITDGMTLGNDRVSGLYKINGTGKPKGRLGGGRRSRGFGANG